jgi:phage-related protein
VRFEGAVYVLHAFRKSHDVVLRQPAQILS